jgi:hypothetical protein
MFRSFPLNYFACPSGINLLQLSCLSAVFFFLNGKNILLIGRTKSSEGKKQFSIFFTESGHFPASENFIPRSIFVPDDIRYADSHKNEPDVTEMTRNHVLAGIVWPNRPKSPELIKSARFARAYIGKPSNHGRQSKDGKLFEKRTLLVDIARVCR